MTHHPQDIREVDKSARDGLKVLLQPVGEQPETDKGEQESQQYGQEILPQSPVSVLKANMIIQMATNGYLLSLPYAKKTD